MKIDIVADDKPEDEPCGSNGNRKDDPCGSNRNRQDELRGSKESVTVSIIDRKSEEKTAYYCTKDLLVLSETAQSLAQSGWYYGHFTSQDAALLLGREPVGTFIIRDSSDPQCLYSLSIKTRRGVTSVRILYSKGVFYLSSDDPSANIPKCDNAVRLVDFYARLMQMGKSGRLTGEKNVPMIQFDLKKPKLNCVLDLKHMCRLSINQHLPKTRSRTKTLDNMDKLPVPKPIKSYLKEYPYIH